MMSKISVLKLRLKFYKFSFDFAAFAPHGTLIFFGKTLIIFVGGDVVPAGGPATVDDGFCGANN